MHLNVGTILGNRYEIIEKIGSGGMAMVYRGKDKKLDRYVSVKVLREEYIGDEEFIERFQTEACSAARLSHPNIVRVYDVGEDGDVNFIVMEYIHGDTLKKAIKEKAPFDSRSTINVAIQIASALSQAHKSHIVHRDIKPQNILVGTDGVIKVTDFGIARAATASTMTTTANAAGSVHYFSPEQARGGYVDEKSDIYSLGITMFEMITGVLPFQGQNSVSIALKHISEGLPDIRQYNPKCSPSLEGIIKKATMKKADERYASIDLLLADLIMARTDTGTSAKPIASQATQMTEAAVVAATTASSVSSHSDGARRSRRAEVAAELRAAQEKEEQEKDEQDKEFTKEPIEPVQAEQSEPDAIELVPEETRKDPPPKELEYIKSKRELEKEKQEFLGESLVGFEKYGKRLALSKEDDYEEEYVKATPVKVSKRPEKEKARRNPRKETDYDNEADKKKERGVIIAAIATSVVLIAIITVMGLHFFGNSSIGGFVAEEKTVSMPLLIGEKLEDAKAAAETLGIELVEEGQDYSPYLEAGYIIFQSVGEGEMIAANSRIGIKISAGLSSEPMPKLVGETENAANEKLVTLIGVSPRVSYEYDEEIAAGIVISQTPQEGEKINAQSSVLLVVSKGQEGKDIVVPNLVGSDEAKAIQGIEAVGLRLGSVSRTPSANVEKGKVITQTLSAGQSVPPGSVMNLVISEGAPETPSEEVPNPDVNDNTIDNNTNTEPNTDVDTNTDTNTNTNTNSNASGVKSFMIQAPSGASGDVYVRVVRDDVNGVYPSIDEYRSVDDFPYTIQVEGTGVGTVSCYIDESLQWTQTVNFSE